MGRSTGQEETEDREFDQRASLSGPYTEPMIYYNDTTFCVSPGCINKCGRKMTPEVQAAAEKWWGESDPPICQGYFCDDRGELLVHLVSNTRPTSNTNGDAHY